MDVEGRGGVVSMRQAKPTMIRTVGSASHASIREAAERAAFDKRAAEVAEWLGGLDDEAFRDLVRKEACGELPADVADVFGHVLVCHRWLAVLKALHAEAVSRRGNGKLQAKLADRRARAVHAIREADKIAHGFKPHNGKPKSVRARAIDRLIELHLAEFEQLISDEEARDAEEAS